MILGGHIVYIKPCVRCKKPYTVMVKTSEFIDYVHNGKLIQTAMPNTKPADREFFVSGLCPTCFKEVTEVQCEA